jgi:hypothetical protein
VVRYLEIFDGRLVPFLPGAAFTGYPPAPPVVVYGCTVDSGVVIDNAAGQTVFAVPHLIGKTVAILADGAVQPSQVVDPSGNVTLTRPSFRTIIGLPFRSEIGLLTPEVGTGTGSAIPETRSERQMLGLVEKFDRWDYNGDGELSVDEIKAGIATLAGTSRAVTFDAAEVVKHYDRNGNNTVSLREAQAGYRRTTQEDAAPLEE